jgi:hypothetical protein
MYLMRNRYADGYQDAIQEVADKWITEGAESALAYIKANLRKAEVAEAVRLFQQELDRTAPAIGAALTKFVEEN